MHTHVTQTAAGAFALCLNAEDPAAPATTKLQEDMQSPKGRLLTALLTKVGAFGTYIKNNVQVFQPMLGTYKVTPNLVFSPNHN